MNKDISRTLITDLIIEDLANKKLLVKPSYYKGYKNNADHLITWLDGKHIDDMTTEIWNGFFDVLREEYSGSSTSHYKTVLNSVYKLALLNGLVSENLVQSVYVGKRLVEDKDVFSENEIEKLLLGFDDFDIEKVLIQLIIFTGLTIGELMALTECDYDAANNRLRISKTIVSGEIVYSNKDGSIREVLLNQLALEAIERLIDFALENTHEECQVLTSHNNLETKKFKFLALNSKTNKRYKSVELFRSSFFKVYCETLNIRYLTPSKLRDTAIVKFIKSGATPEWINEQVGHSDVNKLKLQYGEWFEAMKQNSDLTNGGTGNKAHFAANDPSFEKSTKSTDVKKKFSFLSFLKSLLFLGDKAA
jgi:integrase